MKLSGRDKVLLALLAEYARDDGDFRRVNAALMEMEGREFRWALMKLATEGYVEGVRYVPPDAASPDDVLAMNRDGLRLTRAGVERAEALAGTAGKSDAQKPHLLANALQSVGCQLAANLIWERL